VREKDGLWAVLFWLNILAARRESVAEIVRQHWARYGRDYYSRHDYEGIDSSAAEALVESLRGRVDGLAGQSIDGHDVEFADDFGYTDPVDSSISRQQGIRILLRGGARIVYRLSGTGTEGATLRVYIESFETDPVRQHEDPQLALGSVIELAARLAEIEKFTGRNSPDVIT
jgi:phosphoglucomutase